VENLLDSWGQPGLNPKCELRCLPTTIDEFMAQQKPTDNTYPTLRTLQQYPTIINNPDDSHDIILRLGKQLSSDMNNLPDSRKSMDMFCDACGQHGHPWKRCDYLAKLIKKLDFASKLDKPKQLEILAAFHKEQQKQCDNRIKRNLGHARTLKDNGDIEGLYNLLLEENNNEWPTDCTPGE
jgi:hypothetical protein